MGKYGKRVFDVHQEATFDELHEAICTSFNRGLGYHLCQFRYPIDSYFARPTGMKKADLLEWCLAFGVPTEGLKVPEMKSRLSAISKRLEDEQRQRYREWEFNGDAAPGSKKLKSFVVEDETHGYGVSEGFENKHVGSQKTKLSDVMLAKGDLLEYIWDLGANWSHVMVVESSRDATRQDWDAREEARARSFNQYSEDIRDSCVRHDFLSVANFAPGRDASRERNARAVSRRNATSHATRADALSAGHHTTRDHALRRLTIVPDGPRRRGGGGTHRAAAGDAAEVHRLRGRRVL